jgi:hypothetical protein
MLKEEYRESLSELDEISKNDQLAWEEIEKSEDVSSFLKFIREQGLIMDSLPDLSQRLAPVAFGKTSLYKTFKVLEEVGIDFRTFYRLNSMGLRSDEFTADHDGMHVLFAGCSITAGEGIPLEYMWSHKVYSEIKKSEKVSGYFNIAKPGSTLIDSITQITQYIDLFGKPDVLFFNIPDFEREHSVIFSDMETTPIMSEILKLRLSYGTYDLFRKFCNENNIKLFTFTWDHPEETIWDYPFNPVYKFEDFYLYSAEEREKYLFDYRNVDMPYPDYRYTAFDGAHPGFAANAFYADFILEHYKAWKNNDQEN